MKEKTFKGIRAFLLFFPRVNCSRVYVIEPDNGLGLISRHAPFDLSRGFNFSPQTGWEYEGSRG